MKNILYACLMAFTLIIPFENYAQSQIAPSSNEITPDDVNMLIGGWTGTLTYMDYSSNKPYEMPANLIIEQGKNPYQLKLSNSYPNEPRANNSDKIRISKDRTLLNKIPIISRQTLTNGQIQITTETVGKDGNEKKTALIRKVYIIGPKIFIIRKEIQFEGSNEWIKRNEYSYQRN